MKIRSGTNLRHTMLIACPACKTKLCVTIGDIRLQNEALLSIGEVAELLSAHKNTVRRWEERGILPKATRTEAGARRFKVEDIEAVLLARERKAK